MQPEKKRLYFALRLLAVHISINIITAVCIMVLVFGIWFPYPYFYLMGGLSLVGVILAVDIVCGPILTAVLANPEKSKRELCVDLSLVAVIQLAALIYGLHAVSLARPVLAVFETDRFYIVSRAEIDDEKLSQAPEGFSSFPFVGIRRMGLRIPKDNNEKMDSITLSLQGIPPSVRPNWWQFEDAATRMAVRNAMKPVKNLIEKYPGHLELHSAITESGLPETELFYLPLTSKKDKNWTVLLDADTKFKGFVRIDAFF